MAHLHQKSEDISPFSTAETVVDLLLLVHHKGGGFFRMEGAEPLVVSSGFFEVHIVRDDFQNARPFSNF
jgi:hypothetical protein